MRKLKCSNVAHILTCYAQYVENEIVWLEELKKYWIVLQMQPKKICCNQAFVNCNKKTVSIFLKKKKKKNSNTLFKNVN